VDFIEIKSNPGRVRISEIPVLDYSVFRSVIDDLLADGANHCLSYSAFPLNDRIRFICCIGCDDTKSIRIFSHEQEQTGEVILDSISAKHFQFHGFEREIHENLGIGFNGHPWLKPVRYPGDRCDIGQTMDNYPFYSIDSEELHEVGVGPIHAGIIEPGYFRFICSGEKVLHLEIQLGYQHRGVERLMVQKESFLVKAVLAESIAGDTVIGHSLCHAGLVEILAGADIPERTQIERVVALELERVAIHIGDTAALCADIAYQFGQVVNEALRTIVINTMQLWCGNRFGKGLIRPRGSHYPLNEGIIKAVLDNLEDVEKRYVQMAARLFSMPSLLSRFEGTGKVTLRQASLIGAVGMAARSSGLKRDTRWSHPFQAYKDHTYEPVVLRKGDVLSRSMLRKIEVERSIGLIRSLVAKIGKQEELSSSRKPGYELKMDPGMFAVSLVEGWRGEICHTALTDESGKIIHYKIKDPSFHNWMALALAVREQEISDFPLCNKSFNLSYCGNDL
jgi:Ni,Fe-hydrogenase III large subunit